MKLGPGLSFSWKRALGVTKAKRRVSKKTGIPMSRGGRRESIDLASSHWLSGVLAVEEFQRSWNY